MSDAMPAVTRHRASYIGAPEMFELNEACKLINESFKNDGFGCYLVGSSLVKRDFRDVDVRYIMEDDKFEAWFGAGTRHFVTPEYWARWSFLCTVISRWLEARTGLHVDFQFQPQTWANEKYSRKEGHIRNALGHSFDGPGDRP